MQTENLQILTPTEMQAAEADVIATGMKSERLMENAGSSIASEVFKRYRKCKTLVLCGPGNNGGDGFVIARLLKNKGWPVKIGFYGDAKKLKGDALKSYKKLKNVKLEKLSSQLVDTNELVIDALFGIGLSRELPQELQDFIEYLNGSDNHVVAVDIPTGVNAETGKIMGNAIIADLTITFAAKKLGHVLLPGSNYCGEILVKDISVPIQHANIHENSPELWIDEFPFLKNDTHKYKKGHAVIAGGELEKSGAAKLAALAALRIGAGLVTITTPKAAQISYSLFNPSIMNALANDSQEFKAVIHDARKNAVLIGPGIGVGENTIEMVQAALAASKTLVLDADGITSFANNSEALFKLIKNLKSKVVMTPHEGEFARIFPELMKIENLAERAIKAAKQSGTIVVYKGPNTIIASPNGEAVINTNSSPVLATAGTGDVLAGIITGLVAQNMPLFSASCCGVYLHSEAANLFGVGLISSDLPDLLPEVLKQLY